MAENGYGTDPTRHSEDTAANQREGKTNEAKVNTKDEAEDLNTKLII